MNSEGFFTIPMEICPPRILPLGGAFSAQNAEPFATETSIAPFVSTSSWGTTPPPGAAGGASFT